MKFKINYATYKIIEVSQNDLINEWKENHKDDSDSEIYVYGHTDYRNHTIKICKELCAEEKIRTLKHELCHCWMWNTANSNQEEYNEEHICEIVAASNDFINEVIDEYKSKHK